MVQSCPRQSTGRGCGPGAAAAPGHRAAPSGRHRVPRPLDGRRHTRAFGPGPTFFSYHPQHFMNTDNVFADRRRRLAAQLGPNAVAIVPTAAPQPRNRDSEHPYRFDSYFYYLTGFTEPHAWLVLDHLGHSTLFCQPKDLAREIWDGYRLGPQDA